MAFPLLERFRKMQSDEQALLLHSRLNSFGQSCAQGADRHAAAQAHAPPAALEFRIHTLTEA